MLAMLLLLAISLFCYLAGVISWKRPDVVQQRLESIDGLYMVVAPETHRALIAASGVALVALSFVVLLLAVVRLAI
jgi:hypothetical protein